MKRSAFKKKRKKSLASLKKKLWKIFSEYIRRREADENGMVTCISCGTSKRWNETHAGHYIPKSLGLSIYFDERNVNVQCAACNTFRHGNLSQYALALKKKYGEEILDQLDSTRKSPVKFSRSNYEEMILKYQGLLK